MSAFWSDFVSRLDPYVPGEQPKQSNLIKLNTNENPYPPSPKVHQALSTQAIDSLRLYPDPDSSALKATVASHCGVRADNVFVGNGSDEVLALAFMTFFKQAKPLLFPEISYSFYPVYCQLYDINYQLVPMTDTLGIDIEHYKKANGGIIFPNPNAPTGLGLALDHIENLLQSSPHSVVIVDEAYIDFGGNSATALVSQYPNLLVVQTLSKSRSLAGLRVGYAIGDAGLIEGLDRVKNSFNSYPIDRVAELAAVAAIEDVEYFTNTTNAIVSTREWTTRELERLSFEVLPSQANFVFAKPLSLHASTLFTQLREHNILVRYFDKPRISDFLRITIGTDQQMQALVTAIEQIQG